MILKDICTNKEFGYFEDCYYIGEVIKIGY